MHISRAKDARVDGFSPSTLSRMLGAWTVGSGHAGHGRRHLVWLLELIWLLEATPQRCSEELTRDLRLPGRNFPRRPAQRGKALWPTRRSLRPAEPRAARPERQCEGGRRNAREAREGAKLTLAELTLAELTLRGSEQRLWREGARLRIAWPSANRLPERWDVLTRQTTEGAVRCEGRRP